MKPRSKRFSNPNFRDLGEEERLTTAGLLLFCYPHVFIHFNVGTVAATDPADKLPLNYDQVFIRDFVPSALAFLLNGEGEIVNNFLLHTLQLHSWEKTVDCHSPGQGLMPASFKMEKLGSLRMVINRPPPTHSYHREQRHRRTCTPQASFFLLLQETSLHVIECQVRLMILDEIHLLGCGPILEIIVSKMRYISSQMDQHIWSVGLPTALANARNLADWLGVEEIGLLNFKPSIRPVPLEVHI